MEAAKNNMHEYSSLYRNLNHIRNSVGSATLL